jgi:outer membrane protein OmpA-like peptidoglycan-associated protein
MYRQANCLKLARLRRTGVCVAIACLLLATPGCGTVSKSKFTAAESQNRNLKEQVGAQLSEIENLRSHNNDLKQRLLHAEDAISSATAAPFGDVSRQRSSQSARALEQLARSGDPFVYDAEAGACKFTTDIVFADGTPRLDTPSEAELLRLAVVLRQEGSHGTRVMIAGHAARDERPEGGSASSSAAWQLSSQRALAVRDYLTGLGVPGGRMAIAAFGSDQPVAPNSHASGRSANRRVEVFMIEAERPVVGWTDTITRLYR